MLRLLSGEGLRLGSRRVLNLCWWHLTLSLGLHLGRGLRLKYELPTRPIWRSIVIR